MCPSVGYLCVPTCGLVYLFKLTCRLGNPWLFVLVLRNIWTLNFTLLIFSQTFHIYFSVVCSPKLYLEISLFKLTHIYLNRTYALKLYFEIHLLNRSFFFFFFFLIHLNSTSRFTETLHVLLNFTSKFYSLNLTHLL